VNDNEIYQSLKSGLSPRYIEGMENFDDSEVVQWLVSYHEEVKSELLEALQAMLNKAYKQNWNENYPDEIELAQAAIAKALGNN